MLEDILKKAKFRDFVIIFLGTIGIIAIWRGIWNLIDLYLFPENLLLSQIISIIIGLFILIGISKINRKKK